MLQALAAPVGAQTPKHPDRHAMPYLPSSPTATTAADLPKDCGLLSAGLTARGSTFAELRALRRKRSQSVMAATYDSETDANRYKHMATKTMTDGDQQTSRPQSICAATRTKPLSGKSFADCIYVGTMLR